MASLSAFLWSTGIDKARGWIAFALFVGTATFCLGRAIDRRPSAVLSGDGLRTRRIPTLVPWSHLKGVSAINDAAFRCRAVMHYDRDLPVVYRFGRSRPTSAVIDLLFADVSLEKILDHVRHHAPHATIDMSRYKE